MFLKLQDGSTHWLQLSIVLKWDRQKVCRQPGLNAQKMAFLHFHTPDRIPRIVSLAVTVPALCATMWIQDARSQASQEADPSRIEDQLIEREVPSRKPTADDLSLGIAAAGTDDINVPPFILSGVTVEGATAFSGEEIAATYASLLATQIGSAELEAIA